MSVPAVRRGLREAHAHLGALGEALLTESLEACRSVEECLHRVREVAARTVPGGWVRLRSARTEAWREARWPTRLELDGAAGGRPCVIKSFDHHHGVANSAALESAGLRGGDRVAPHGIVVADADGAATGELVEQAMWAVWRAAPCAGDEERVEHVRAALAHLGALGFTSVHDMYSEAWLGPALGRLERAGELAMAVWLYAPKELAAEFAERPWEGGGVRFAGLKAFADGTLNSRTALVLHAYAEPAGIAHAPAGTWHGKALMTPGELDEAIVLARAMKTGLAVHAIGDGAVRNVLDAWERAGAGASEAGGVPALRIEHAELVDGADVGRFAALGVTCSVQACHLLADVEALTRYLPHRLGRVLPLRELIDAGCRPGELLWFGSDVPIVRADPGDSVRAAVERRREGAGVEEAIAWEQRISEAEAWRAFGEIGGGGREEAS